MENRQSLEQFFLLLSDYAVAFAAAGFQAFPIQNRNRAAIRSNPATILKWLQNVGHAGTSHAKHECQETHALEEHRPR